MTIEGTNTNHQDDPSITKDDSVIAAIITRENSIRSNNSDGSFDNLSIFDNWDIDSNHDVYYDFNDLYTNHEHVIILGSKVVAKDPPGITTNYRQFKRDVIRKRQKIPEDKLHSWVYPELLHYLQLQGQCTTIASIDDIQFFQKQPSKESYRRLTGFERDAAIIRDIQTNNTGRNHNKVNGSDKASSFSIVEQFIADAKAQLKYAKSDITGEIYQLFYGMLNTMELIASAVPMPTSNESLIQSFRKIFKMNFKWFIKPTCGPQKRKPTANAVVAKTPPVRTIECDHGPHASRLSTNETRPKVFRKISSMSLPPLDPQDLEPIAIVEERPTQIIDDHKVTCSERQREANEALAAHPSLRDWNGFAELFGAATFHRSIKVEGGGVGVAEVREPTSRKKRKECESVFTQQGTSENGTTGRSRHSNTAQRPDMGRDDDSISLLAGIMMDEMSMDASIAYNDHDVEFGIGAFGPLDDNIPSQIIKYGDQCQFDL